MADIATVDYKTYAHNILQNQFYNKPNINALLNTFSSTLQTTQDDMFALTEMFYIEQAQGDFLDLLGRIVGEAREGRLDEPYRDAIKLRVLFNTSSGTPNQILTSLKEITGADNVNVWEHFPVASFFFTDGSSVPDRLAGTVGDALPASSGECVILLNQENDAFYGAELESNLYNFVDQDNNQFVDELSNDFVVTAGEFFSVVDSERNFLSEYVYTEPVENYDGLGYTAEMISETEDSFSYPAEQLALLTSVNNYWTVMNYTVPSNLG